MPLRSVIISGGGTGGHIYPALAIADEIQRRYPECVIRFVGAEGRMEMEKVPAAGYPIDGLWITGIERKVISKKNLLFPFRLLSSLRKSGRLISAYQPDAVVGVGGFASGPLLYVAAGRRIPTLIQEQNSYPGITNKLLAKKASVICTGFPDMKRWFPEDRTVYTGNPLRNSLAGSGASRREAAEHFGISADDRVIFIMGGSLGARSMNDAVSNALERWTASGYTVLWQTGQRFADTNSEKVAELGFKNVKVLGFINRMDYAYAVADVIVSRAGAMSIAELAQVGKPSIFVPSPNVSEDHQTRNARSLTDEGAALLVSDREVRDTLGEVVDGLLSDEARCTALSAKIKTFARPDAASAVVDELERIAK